MIEEHARPQNTLQLTSAKRPLWALIVFLRLRTSPVSWQHLFAMLTLTLPRPSLDNSQDKGNCRVYAKVRLFRQIPVPGSRPHKGSTFRGR